MKKISDSDLWKLTQLVSEKFKEPSIIKWGHSVLGDGYSSNFFKTEKGDEVVQFFNDKECFTYIGGSSGDAKEWLGNFNAFNWKNLFKGGKSILVDGIHHYGFYNGATAVLKSKHFVGRSEKMITGYSRGSAIAQELCYLLTCEGIGIGSPKPFKHKVDISFRNINNKYDPVSYLVPFFKTAGQVVKLKFFKNPHTGYGKHL